MDKKLIMLLLVATLFTFGMLKLPEPAPWNDPCTGRSPNAPGWVCDLRASLGI